MFSRIAKLSDEIHEKVSLIRHDIHKHPETAYKEVRTTEVVERFLDDIGVSHERCTETGVTALIGKREGKVVGLRSELDALPMPDKSGLPYASVHDGTAHACGHDGHIAILLGTAWVLKQLEDELPGKVKLIWQPAEEGGAGAEKMIRHGVLKSPSPEAVFALHGWPTLPVGKAAYRFGSALAAVDNFKIVVKGRGSHGALPHAGIDPITIAARIIEGLQLICSRMIDTLKPSVITVGTIHGGTVENVIPDEVTMTGTIRTLDHDTRLKIPGLMKRMAVETAHASGGDAEFINTAGYPPTINEESATAFARDTLTDILGAENVVEISEPVMGGEDFAYYLEKIPGTFLRLGVGDRPSLHNSSYDFNDEAIPFGIRIMAGIAVRFPKTGIRNK
ncbi:M20 family metallopeptidase [Candidatus Latescibacterota bacterium]